MLLAKPSNLSGGNSGINQHALEVIRYATNNQFKVVGGYSKLINNTINFIPKDISSLYTFTNLRYDSGKLYENSGWELDSLVEPSYFYIKNNSYEELTRNSLMKSKIKEKHPEVYNDKLTEGEMAKLLNLNKVYDAGKLKYILKLQ